MSRYFFLQYVGVYVKKKENQEYWIVKNKTVIEHDIKLNVAMTQVVKHTCGGLNYNGSYRFIHLNILLAS